MKTIHSIGGLLVSTLILAACSQSEVSTQAVPLSQEATLPLIVDKPWYVDKVELKSAGGTEDITQSAPYGNQRNEVFFLFREGSAVFYGGSETHDNAYPAPARTFSLLTRIELPANVTYLWDETEGTLIFESYENSTYFPIRRGQKAVLDKTDYVLYNSLEEAKAAAGKPSYIKLNVADSDAKRGAVTYVFTLKPLWFYYRQPNQQNTSEYVLF